MINLIVAVDDNYGIGKDNKLPWCCSKDLKHFRQLTEPHTVLMGYNTYKSIGKLLPNRHNVICTRQDITVDGAEVVHDLSDYVTKFNALKDLYIIGGASIYNFVMDNKLVDVIYMTRIPGIYGCDAFFDFEKYNNKFDLVNVVRDVECTFQTWVKKF